MVPLVGNIFTICTNLITNVTIGKEIGANGKKGNAIWYQWYKCYQPMVPLENPEHTQFKVAPLGKIYPHWVKHSIIGLNIMGECPAKISRIICDSK